MLDLPTRALRRLCFNLHRLSCASVGCQHAIMRARALHSRCSAPARMHACYFLYLRFFLAGATTLPAASPTASMATETAAAT